MVITEESFPSCEMNTGASGGEEQKNISGITSETLSVLQKAFTDFQVRAEQLSHAYASMKDDFKKVNIELESKNLETIELGGVQVLMKRLDLPNPELVKVATGLSDKGGVAILIAGGETARVVVSSGSPKIKAGEIIAAVCSVLGGKGGGKPTLAQGGGPDVSKIEDALAAGESYIKTALHV